MLLHVYISDIGVVVCFDRLNGKGKRKGWRLIATSSSEPGNTFLNSSSFSLSEWIPENLISEGVWLAKMMTICLLCLLCVAVCSANVLEPDATFSLFRFCKNRFYIFFFGWCWSDKDGCYPDLSLWFLFWFFFQYRADTTLLVLVMVVSNLSFFPGFGF